MSAVKILLLLMTAFHLSQLCEATVNYVKPYNAPCPSEPCHTLDEYADNSTKYFISNTVFLFLNGHHKLSYSVTAIDVHNITLRPYEGKGNVVIGSELRLALALVFELASSVVVKGMTFQDLSIRLTNSANVTLTGLTADNAAVILNNVIGAVDILHFNCRSCPNCCCVTFKWTVTDFPQTVVLLQSLKLRPTGSIMYGVCISGCLPSQFYLLNSTLSSTKAGMSVDLGPSCNDMSLVCSNTLFSNNTAGLILTSQLNNLHSMALALHNVSYTDNGISISLDNIRNATIDNCHFERSYALGAIEASNCVLSLTGNVTFIDCHSHYSGGAIALIGDSRIVIPEPYNTYILFENNTSNDVGGAIYFSDSDTFETGYCKMYVGQIFDKTVFNFTVNFAVNGGNAIYGAHLDALSCFSPNGTLFQNLAELILNVSSFSPSFSEDNSVVSSNAQYLCYCNDDGEFGDCSGPDISIFPGEIFKISVAARGDMNGLVRWPVYADVNQGNFSNVVQHFQNTNAKACTNFLYSVLTERNLSVLYFSLTFHIDNYNSYYIIHLNDCPLGFALSNKYGCECHQYLSQSIANITCNITEQSIQRQGTAWIGQLPSNNSGATLVFSSVCPFLYCTKSNAKILVHENSLLNEDIQCAGNRSGILCGGCRDNFSLALGSNRCLYGCNNNSLSLIIVFAAAGIVLVFFIKILNLTVSQGTINGLIFYANIVGAKQTILFPSKAHSEGFLSVFISWLNLELGIETCFIDGMDAYTKAWLQFVFPVYVWTIAFLIIILSHYSIRVSKLFGNNSVPVLATLILLSYSKLLRAVISALSITEIQFLDSSTMSVWERDGNIQYLTGKHIPLFVLSVAVLVLLWCPFTLVLVSIQWLQRGTHYRVLHWLTKLRPFFDAFTGPLKDKHRHWVGTMLVARCSLLLVFYIFTAKGSGMAFISIMLAAFLILVFLAATTHVYRNYYISVLELSYILNLGILATGTLYIQYINGNGNQEAVTTISVGIGFLQFIATVIYHAYVQLRGPLKKLIMKSHADNTCSQNDAWNSNSTGPEIEYDDYESLDGASYMCDGKQLQRPPFQEIPNFREPLLDNIKD